MTPYIYRASRTGSLQPTAALSDLYIDTYMEDQAGAHPARYSRSSVVSLICWSAKNDRMSTTAGWRMRVSMANLEK